MFVYYHEKIFLINKAKNNHSTSANDYSVKNDDLFLTDRHILLHISIRDFVRAFHPMPGFQPLV